MSIGGIFKVLKSLSPIDYLMLAAAVVILTMSLQLRSVTKSLKTSNDLVIQKASEKAALKEQLLQESLQKIELQETLVQERKTANAERSARESAEQSLQKSQQTLRRKEEDIRDLLKKDSSEIRDCYNTPAPDYIIDRVFGMGSGDESATGEQDGLRREN